VRARFFAPVLTGPGAHPATCKMGTWSFPGVKRPGRGVDHPPHLAPRLLKSTAVTQLTLWPSWPVLGRPLPIYTYILFPKVNNDINNRFFFLNSIGFYNVIHKIKVRFIEINFRHLTETKYILSVLLGQIHFISFIKTDTVSR
jgi:hypothetical protein